MSTLYVANGTKQHHQFLARLPERVKLLDRPIRIGEQIAIKDLTQSDIDAIVAHHEQYGMVAAGSADKGAGKLNTLLYQVDKPVTGYAIERALEHNDGVLAAKGVEQRKVAAIAIDSVIKEAATSAGITHTATDVEIIEQQAGPTDSGPKLEERIAVRAEGDDSVPTPGNRGGRRGRR